MSFSSQFVAKKWLREELLRSESEARLRGPDQQADGLEWHHLGATVSSMTEEDEVKYRRIMAKLHYGEETAIPEYEALLTEGEKECLDAHVIQRRWAQLWFKENS